MPKKFGTNSKKEEAQQKKENQKKELIEKEYNKMEDKKWEDNDKNVLKKQQKEKEILEKKQKELDRKQANKEAYEQEQALLFTKQKQKVTQQEFREKQQKHVVQTYQKLQEQKSKSFNIESIDSDDSDWESKLGENINHMLAAEKAKDEEKYSQVIDASNLEQALNQLDKETYVEKHPEKRVKQAYQNYVEEQLPILKQEWPNQKRSQLLQMIYKNWQKAPENPFNKQYKAYNE